MKMKGKVFITTVLILSCLFPDPVKTKTWWNWLVSESCNYYWIPRDVHALSRLLEDELYGQHVAIDCVLKSLWGQRSYGSDRPLVFSFNGPSGVGKSFTSTLIANAWFRNGRESKYVHEIIGTKDFSNKSEDYLTFYKQVLTKLIKESTHECPYQVFIFDEVEMFPPGLLDALVPFMESKDKIDGVDYRNCIFIFLSKIGSELIRSKTFRNFENGSSRKVFKHKHFEKILTGEMYNSSNTGFSRSQLIDRHLISYYIPFLPLELGHVKQCVKRSLGEKTNKPPKPLQVTQVLREISFEGPERYFSMKGCKDVDEKVNYVSSPSPGSKSSRSEL